MTETGIECFIAICNHKTVSRAAEALFITQSSLSMRLKNLENELGGELFYRKKGCREMTLTAAGEQFHKLALEFQALRREMLDVCKKQPQNFRLSSFNSLGTYFLPEVCRRFLKSYPQIHLELQDMEYNTVKESIKNSNTDLAFSTGASQDEKLLRIPAFREPMVLVCNKELKLKPPITPDSLPAEQEIYIEWSLAFAKWHAGVFPKSNPKITVSMMAQLNQFLSQDSTWAIVPQSVAEGMQNMGIYECPVEFSLPKRDVSLICAASSPSPLITDFCDVLKQYLSEQSFLECLL